MKQLSFVTPALLVLCLACGTDTPSTPSTPTPPPVETPQPPPPPPGPPKGTLTGSVFAGYHGTPVGGATVAFDGLAPVATDAEGGFSLLVDVPGPRRVVVEADGYLRRETFVLGGESKELRLGLIPNNGSYPVTLYRQIARNGYEQPTNLQPLKRWTTTPNFHIETNWRDTGAPIDPAFLNYLESEIRRVIPQLTDGHFQAGRIERGPEQWNFVPDYVSIHFHRSGNWGVLGQNPGQVQFGTAAPCTSIMIIHELAHAMGFWHSSVKPSVMGGMPAVDCNPVNLTADEQQVARILYSRPVGNMEPDRDPDGVPFYLTGPQQASAPVRVVD